MNCQLCENKDLEKILDFGLHPPPLNFLNEENENEKLYPLELYFCNECNLVQLGTAVDPRTMFKKYTYTSGVSVSFRKHLEDFAKYLVERLQLKKDDMVIDIGSNDGTFLEQFLLQNIKVLGVEPSNVAEISKEKNISTINDFFDEKIAKEILTNYGKAKLISALNVFAHVDKLDSFMKGIKILLQEDGIFVTESQYLLDIVQRLEYDTMYHEHLRYYGLKQLKLLFEKYGMEVFDVQRVEAQGGSIRVFACIKGQFTKSSEVSRLLEREDEFKLHDIQTIKEFANRVYQNKEELCKLLSELKSKENKIAAISAPARSCTIFNFCNIDSKIIDFVVEKSPLKIGKYTPGTHIKVVDDSELVNRQPDYALLLSWHLKDSLVPKIRKEGYEGKIIIPLPRVQVV